jgi:hypothetical protein
MNAIIKDIAAHFDAAAELTRCNATVAALRADNLPRPESCCARDARIDSGDDAEVTDEEITEMGAEWGLDKPALIVRLRKYIADSEGLA